MDTLNTLNTLSTPSTPSTPSTLKQVRVGNDKVPLFALPHAVRDGLAAALRRRSATGSVCEREVLGSNFRGGAGYFAVHFKHEGTVYSMYAHRLAWALANNRDVPRSLDICHACDNPRCCTPSHLEPGTVADNMRHMVEAGRASKGAAPMDSAEFARLYSDGVLFKDIASTLGISLQGALRKAATLFPASHRKRGRKKSEKSAAGV